MQRIAALCAAIYLQGSICFHRLRPYSSLRIRPPKPAPATEHEATQLLSFPWRVALRALDLPMAKFASPFLWLLAPTSHPVYASRVSIGKLVLPAKTCYTSHKTYRYLGKPHEHVLKLFKTELPCSWCPWLPLFFASASFVLHSPVRDDIVSLFCAALYSFSPAMTAASVSPVCVSSSPCFLSLVVKTSLDNLISISSTLRVLPFVLNIHRRFLQ